MKQKESNNRIAQLLSEYENMSSIQPSEEWEQNLFTRIRSSRSDYTNKYGGLKSIVFVTCFLLINALFFLRLTHRSGNQLNERNDALQSISNELLINSTNSN